MSLNYKVHKTDPSLPKFQLENKWFFTITTIYNSTTLQSAKLNLVQLGLSQITYKKQLKPKPKLKQKGEKKKERK